MKKFVQIFFVSLFCFGFSTSGFSTDKLIKLNVNVIDSDNSEPLPFAKLILFRYGVQVGVSTTDFDGVATIPMLTPSVYQIRVFYLDYTTVDTSLFLIDPFESITIKMKSSIIIDTNVIITYAIPTIDDSGPAGGTITRIYINDDSLTSGTPPNGIYMGVYTVVGASAVSSNLPALSGYVPKMSSIMPTYSYVLLTSAPQIVTSYGWAFNSGHRLESGYHGVYCTGLHNEPWDFLVEEEHPELDLFLIDKYGMKGVMNSDSVMVIEPVYNTIREMHGIYYDRFIVQKGDYFGVLDGENKWVLPLEFDEIYSCSKRLSCVHARNLLVVKKNGKYGLFTTNGDTIVFPKYDYLDSRLDEFACPCRATRYDCFVEWQVWIY